MPAPGADTTKSAKTTSTLVEKLAYVMGQIERIPKRGHNAFFNYDYVTEADLVAEIRPLLAEAGVMIIPSVTSQETDYDVVRERSGTAHLTKLMVEYTITDGKESLNFSIPGFGVDRADKGIYKALTGSMKYALMKLFLVDTGDDPEMSREVPTQGDSASQGVSITPSHEEGIGKGGHSKSITRYQLQRIASTMREKGMDRTDLLVIIADRFGTELVLPDDEALRSEAVLEYLSGLEYEDAGLLIADIEAWGDTDGTA